MLSRCSGLSSDSLEITVINISFFLLFFLFPKFSTLYWTNWNRDHPCIERSNVDGSDRSVIVRTGLSQPSAVTFDPWNKSYIFWIDEDRSQGTFKIERSLLDGSEREVICR